MQNVLGLLILGVCCVGLYRYYRHSPHHIFFLPAMLFKLLAGVAYGGLYVVYYKEVGDSLNYFHDATKLCDLGRQDIYAYMRTIFLNEYAPIWDTKLMLWQEPRAFWFVKLVSLPMWILGENYWILASLFSLLSFWGSWVLVEALSKRFPQTSLAAIIAFLFFPSVVFFGAGLTKESIAVALLGWGTATLLHKFSWKTLPTIGICAWGLLQLKFYYLAFWAGSAIAFIITYPLCIRWQASVWAQYFIFGGVLGLGAYTVSYVFDFDEFMLMIVLNHNTTYIHSQPQDLVHYSIHGGQGYISLEAHWWSLLYNVPLALEAGLFRPYIWEASDKLKVLMGLENAGILVLIVMSLWVYLRQVWAGKVRTDIFTRLFICSVVFFVLGLLIVIALASPNFGALVRYKVVVTSWIVYGVGIILLSKKKMEKMQ